MLDKKKGASSEAPRFAFLPRFPARSPYQR